MVTFTAHLSVTIKRLTRYKQKVVLAAMLEGKSMPPTWQPIESYYFVEKSKYHKISPLNAFPLKFLSIFGVSKIPTHYLKEALVT